MPYFQREIWREEKAPLPPPVLFFPSLSLSLHFLSICFNPPLTRESVEFRVFQISYKEDTLELNPFEALLCES